ncbi:MAG: aminotransferase class III-fold pyridoxal phosphate-dependent enzyme [Holophagales bacterium]|nr:aminotransferase class III-fold pyridoxal phosphate-dependent enzyme [Holophagales bacterium]
MSSETAPRRPELGLEDARALARERYGLDIEAHELDGYVDRNFRLVPRSEASGGEHVLEISLGADRSALDLEIRALEHLSGRQEAVGLGLPRPVLSAGGAETVELEDALGRPCRGRLTTYVPGRPLAEARPHTVELLRSVGRALGRLDLALADFEHPAMDRDFHWDLARAPEVLRERVAAIEDGAIRGLVERVAEDHAARVAPDLGGLRRSVIHGDANDHNLLIAGSRPIELSGLIDFGDLVRSHTVNEVAIAGAYLVMGKAEPLRVLGHLVAGYHREHPLDGAELEVLVDLVRTRLAVSLSAAAFERQQEPSNTYLSVSALPARRALERLAGTHPRLATYHLRAACGLPASPRAPRLRAWLGERRGTFSKLVDAARREDTGELEKVLVLDLSVSSVELATMSQLTDPHELDRRVAERMGEAGADVAYGRWDEPRLLYAGGQFAGQPFDPDPGDSDRTAPEAFAEPAERRTVHMGIDLFQPAGSAVYAPLAGTIHSLADNDQPFDYGGTLVLEHRVSDDRGELVFYSLYGHLSKASLEGKFEGMVVEEGDELGHLGEVGENGGWAPHLHYQLTLDLLDRYGDFPGVVAPSERAMWRDLCPDPNPIVGVPGRAFEPPHGPEPEMGADEILERRLRRLGKSYSISYRRPLHMVAGRGQWLYDAEGRAYLDAVNNVPHVGHCHPRVARAAARQKAVLETNTRYLHAEIVRYSERLVAHLPEPLRVVFFCNSGSEANDLALRLARIHTGRDDGVRGDVVTVEGAYHGHTGALIDISPYKYRGPGGAGAPEWVQEVPLPCGYRGRYRREEHGDELGSRYARHVDEACAASGKVAAFFCESVLGCGGQVVLPPGYLEAAYAHVRRHGGLAVADEVQVGFGRVGSHFWAFETQGVVPDILTLGKPIGNGHPLAAVITTEEVARSFANGMEYFNTFGGNPVSCRVGMAVLDVIENEGLQTHALEVGEHLLAGLRHLGERYPLIGEVRGLGLFLGVELVRDRATLEPAASEAAYVADRMRDHRILISTDGPWHNVLKIKPPLVFDREDADHLITTLDRILEEDGARA